MHIAMVYMVYMVFFLLLFVMSTAVAQQNVRDPRYFVTTRCSSSSQYRSSISLCFIFCSVVVSSNLYTLQTGGRLSKSK